MIILLEQIFEKGGIYMRIMPFMKRKKGIQFAGVGLDTGGGGGGSYVLPPATSSTLGGVKVGTGLEVAEDGTLSSSGGGGGLNYSTTRQNTGVKWIDGKDIYVKTIVDTKTGTSQQELVIDADFGQMVKIEAFASHGSYPNTVFSDSDDSPASARMAWDNSTGTMYYTINTSGTHTATFICYYTLS